MSQMQDRIASMVHAFGDQERKDEVRALAQDVGALEDRLAELERELEQAREGRARAAMDARNPLLARLAAMDAEAKQAREDEAWARDNGVVTGMASAWITSQRPETLTFGGSINAAIRALRAKVEGGAR